MQFSADYTIKTAAGDVPLLFNTYAYKKYSERQGMDLDGLMVRVKELIDQKGGIGRTQIPDLLLSGHQSYCAYNKLPFTAGELEATGWMDEMGGLLLGMGGFTDVIVAFISKLLNVDPDAVKVEAEKKSDLTPELTQPGESSSSSPLKLA